MNTGFPEPHSVQTSSVGQKPFRKPTTHLALIAMVLQRSPRKMLTFPQLMSELEPLVPRDSKSMEANIRVCLSKNRCFVKIPKYPGIHYKNYWKLDISRVTEKMARRHFSDMLEVFPELASKVNRKHMIGESMQDSVELNRLLSMEPFLQSDGVPSEMARTLPLPRVVQQQQQPRSSHTGQMMSFSCWDSEELPVPTSSSGMSSMCSAGGSTHHGFTAAEEPVWEMNEYMPTSEVLLPELLLDSPAHTAIPSLTLDQDVLEAFQTWL